MFEHTLSCLNNPGFVKFRDGWWEEHDGRNLTAGGEKRQHSRTVFNRPSYRKGVVFNFNKCK